MQETRSVSSSRVEANKLTRKTKLKPTSASSSSHSPIHIPIHQRNWLDVEPIQHSHKDAHCSTISKKDDRVVQARNSSSRTGWSSGILEIESRIYVELPTVTTLVSSIVVKSLGNWRRTQEDIPVLY